MLYYRYIEGLSYLQMDVRLSRLSHKTSQNTFGKVMMGRRGLRAIKCPGGFINQDNIREHAANVDPNPHTYLLDASRVALRFG